MLVSTLACPPEPVEVKDDLARQFEMDYRRTSALIKQSTWIAGSLWTDCGWRDVLQASGVTWQRFMEATRDCYGSWVDWVQGSLSWNAAVQKLVERLAALSATSRYGSGQEHLGHV